MTDLEERNLEAGIDFTDFLTPVVEIRRLTTIPSSQVAFKCHLCRQVFVSQSGIDGHIVNNHMGVSIQNETEAWIRNAWAQGKQPAGPAW